MNKVKKYVVFAVIMVLLTAPAFSVARSVQGEANGRYFIETTRSLWRTTLTTRNLFSDGFTTDLSDWQVGLLRFAGVKVYPVKRFYILPEDTLAKPDKSPGKPPGKQPEKTPTRFVPSEQVPWGVKEIYGDTLSDKPFGGSGVSVAILDTGIVKGHPDISRRVTICKDFTQRKQPMVNDSCNDKNGHGTHVAGTIAADGGVDGLGIYGVAPEADIAIYKVCSNNGSCWSDDIAMALREAAADGANIVNLSLGSDSYSSLIDDAINEILTTGSILVVAAAGNDGPYDESIDYPGALVSVVAVGAIDRTFSVTEWSSRGINEDTTPYVTEEKDVEFAVPGMNIESAWKDGGYAILSGTSMATPHISGLAAKLWQFDELQSAELTREVLHLSAFDIEPSGDDNASGWGIPKLSLPEPVSSSFELGLSPESITAPEDTIE